MRIDLFIYYSAELNYLFLPYNFRDLLLGVKPIDSGSIFSEKKYKILLREGGSSWWAPGKRMDDCFPRQSRDGQQYGSRIARQHEFRAITANYPTDWIVYADPLISRSHPPPQGRPPSPYAPTRSGVVGPLEFIHRPNKDGIK